MKMRLLSLAYRHRHRPTTLSSKLLRNGSILHYNFSSSSKKKKDDDTTLHQLTSTDQINATTRSVGQVIFLNSLQSSRILFASLVIADPQLACLAALGGGEWVLCIMYIIHHMPQTLLIHLYILKSRQQQLQN